MVSIVLPNEFLARKEYANESHLKKYEAIFNGYNCFLSEHTIGVTPNSKKKHNHSIRPPINRRINKDPTKAIIAFLNIINLDNFNKVFSKLRLIIDNNNLNMIILTILEKCCKSSFFINVYIKLLIDLQHFYDIKSNITGFAKTAIYKIDMIKDNNNNDKEYDIFCALQKHKSYVLGIATTITKLHSAALIEPHHFANFCQVFISRLESLHKNEEYLLDLYLNVLVEVSKSNKDYIKKHMTEDLIDHIISCQIPRIKFLLQGLLEM